MFERYTEKARRVIFFARYEASQYGSPSIQTEHLLLGFFREDKALALRLLPGPEPVEKIRVLIDKRSEYKPKIPTNVDLPLSEESKRVLTYAKEEADRLGHKHIGTEHLLLGSLREERSFAAEILRGYGFEIAKVRERIAKWPSHDVVRVHPYFGLPSAVRRETLLIRGVYQDAETVRIRVEEYRAHPFHWRQEEWAWRDLVVERSTGQISFDLSLAQDKENFELAEKAWKYDTCGICGWTLDVSSGPEHTVGYTNGRDWVCTECYEKFLKGPDYFQSEYGDIT